MLYFYIYKAIHFLAFSLAFTISALQLSMIFLKSFMYCAMDFNFNAATTPNHDIVFLKLLAS